MMEYALTVNGENLRYYDEGAGEPLLFLHGILGDHRIWAPHCNYLSTRYRALAYTLKGFRVENSTIDSQEFNTDIHSDELIHFCDALGLKGVTVVGWSYASHVALLAAKKRPDLFKSLILYELIVPSYGMTEEDLKLFSRDLTRMMSPVIKALRRDQLVEAASQFIAACTSDRLTLEGLTPRLQVIKRDNLHTLPLLLKQSEPKAISADELNALPMPITVLCGENSRDIFYLATKAAATAINQSRDFIVKGRDHHYPEEEAIHFSQLIESLLNP